jgi:RND family efflux transporter MFP subunit
MHDLPKLRLCRWATVAALLLLWGCGKSNTYVPAPPPKVAVAMPVKQSVTNYLNATGYVAAIQSVDLVARVQGFLEGIDYQDGGFVKAGTVLFRIEPEPYQQKLALAEATQASAQATLAQAAPEFQRQAALNSRGNASQAAVDQARAARDTAQASLQQDAANVRLAQINLGYTEVKAPFDGIVTAHLVSIGEFVGAGTTPTQLATIVQLDPIYINFTLADQDVQRLREDAARRGITTAELRQQLKTIPIDAALPTETGFPHHGTVDYFSPVVDQSTGTHAVRGIFNNPDRMLLPGNFVRVRVPTGTTADALLVPDVAIGSDLAGRYLLVVKSDNVVEQRRVEVGAQVGSLRVITGGIKPDDRVVVAGLLRAIPGEKVAPELQVASASPGAATK